jgi:hypothetical protein
LSSRTNNHENGKALLLSMELPFLLLRNTNLE